MNEKEAQTELSEILGIKKYKHGGSLPATWSEIYVEIGRLQERAVRNLNQPVWNPPQEVNQNPNLHYHNGMPCYNNPCVWFGDSMITN